MGPLAMYDNDRMRIDVDVVYEDDERLGCRGVYGRDEERVTRSAGSRYEGEKSKDKAVKVSETGKRKRRDTMKIRAMIYMYKNRYLDIRDKRTIPSDGRKRDEKMNGNDEMEITKREYLRV